MSLICDILAYSNVFQDTDLASISAGGFTIKESISTSSAFILTLIELSVGRPRFVYF